ncbi:hypothetical protein SRB5_07770 [Streptomyces sp. RB5]|uniref:Uncharacterized protein n=1 Tax=Streptomyces smaragdinus TaxID=2585196 RepID=A0A7K0CB48_9ACTN|nr:hypothetical protein [Streptomyces smaragdinus]MQY10665.1 hypothetical protein [Streptomyces smaragdinus]
MICPHCESSLLLKERPDRTCGKCGRRYALDPKTNPLKLNDLRVRRVTLRLTRDGEVPCTPGQLWYALTRKTLGNPGDELGCAFGLVVFGVVGGFAALGAHSAALGVVCVLLLLAAGVFVVVGYRQRGRPKVSREEFRGGLLEEWRTVYGSLPPGMVDDGRYPRPAPGADGPVLVCPDTSVAVFLDAAGLPARYGLTLVADPAHARPAPVLFVLHDADAHGLLLAHRVRAAHPGRRVVDLGLPLATMRRLSRAVPVRDASPGAEVMEPLARSGEFPPDQLKWLGKGWGFPLIAVPPAGLLAVVTRAVDKAAAATDPQRRRAAATGFLTWPGEAG